jgi:glycolate oxidase iron-sulfur subunit
MRHEIDILKYGAEGEAMVGAIESCVHCGFCLPTCPTYVEQGEEMDSPRGRIILMKEVLEGKLTLEEALPYVDNCLGCQACETACPSGVAYGDLLTPFRAHAEAHRRRGPLSRLERVMMLETLPYPRRFRAAARLGRLARPLAGVLPGSMGAMLRLLPERLPRERALPRAAAARGPRRARVALLAGCAQRVLDPDIASATLEVLALNGVEVVVPDGQGCCGALPLHAGARDKARALARRTLKAFDPDDVDAIIMNAAGCGSGMKEYPLLFADAPEEEAARAVAAKVVDITTFLADLGLAVPVPGLDRPLKVAYHDACHLAHAQRETTAPRTLLRAIGGVELVEPEGWELCCGSAGTYNVEKPDIAARLGARKAENLLATGADLVASGNIGCLTQVRTHLRAAGRELPVMHTVQVLARAYARTLDPVRT